MDRIKRTITKPSRYQTTSSDEAPRAKAANSTKVQDMETIEDDISHLRAILEKNSSQDNAHNTESQYNTPCIDKLAQTGAQVHYLPPTSNTYTALQAPYHVTRYGMYSPSLEKEQTSNIRTAARNEAHLMNMHTNIEPIHDTDNQNIHGRLDNVQAELRKLNSKMDQILKCIQNKENKLRVPHKPALLPISTVEEMVRFERVDEKTYEEVVSYFHHVGGFTPKEAINLAFKEAMKDCIAAKYTWFGREGGVHPLYNTRIIMAIYDSVCNNNYFCKPTKAEFQNIAREALRSAKQRHRTSTRILRNREQQARGARHFWDDSHVENELQPDVMEPNNIIETNIMEFNVTENED